MTNDSEDIQLGLNAPQRGIPPTYRNLGYERSYTTEPNQAAIGDRYFFAPALNDRFTPQGIDEAYGKIFVSSYGSGCKLFVLNPSTGDLVNPSASRSIPSCVHAGGVAVVGNFVFVSDTANLFRIPISNPNEDSISLSGEIIKMRLPENIRGSFAARFAGKLYLGHWSATGNSYLRRFKSLPETGKSISTDSFDVTYTLPRKAQGAAFDYIGVLYVSFSDSTFGCLLKYSVNGPSLTQQAMFKIPRASEGLGFFRNILWSVSESGSWKWRDWQRRERPRGPFFRFVFGLDVNLLQQGQCKDEKANFP